MDSDATQSDSYLRFVTWFQANLKRLIIGTVIVLAAIAVVAFISYEQGQKEVRASHALANVAVPLSPTAPMRPGTADAYLKVAKEHAGTKAGARALLQAGATYFVEGNYADAQKTFEQFLKEYPASEWIPQAHFGIASSLDAQGKTADAVTKFEEMRRRFANDATSDEVKLALARLFETQNKPADAHKIYSELVQANPYSGMGSEAGVRKEELEKKFPELARTNAPMTSLQPTSMPLVGVTNQPAPTNRVITITNRIRTATNAAAQAATNVQSFITNAPLLLQQPSTNAAKP
jgi:predicted negative regulator of RcsB-dependent stress response